ncbi:MAG: hypothetical protein JSV05_02540 [Candidatus Bathyarchaeota archaeon]|nr:MAG: hypothetical protein JSV05_02540 [Candidatus Bathyarchaeota archaeon]
MPISGEIYYWGERAKHVLEDPGVYAFYDKDRKLIYIGESENLRKTFTQCLETTFSQDSCKKATVYYRREFTPNQQQRMKELLEEYQEKHNKLPECNGPFEPDKDALSEMGFHFYKNIGEPIHQIALNIQDFKEKLPQIPVSSLEFHHARGDFAKWISEALKDSQLAEKIQKIDQTGEALRVALLVAFGHSNQAQCPTCEVQTIPAKTWKMAGRPDRAGERMQLTIGYYKCHNCSKTFRHVLAKEKIKASITA